MSAIINWLAIVFDALPLPLLEVWGRLAYIIGFALAISAFGGFTFRPGGRWGWGRERQAWDAKAVLSIPVTFVFIIATGYIGSFIVLVPGAQTFESLKDLMVFLCIVLFGYPALIAVPFAYGISDLIEGVPPGFLLDWLPGYFINPACFWVAYQLFGKNPDFRRAKTWGLYLLFVLAFMSTEPFLWGYICAGKFTSLISYGNITPALFFTTGITWIMAPFAMLVALPLARKTGMFWAEIPGHVKERLLARKEWVWQAGANPVSSDTATTPQGWPIRIVLLAPFIVLVLLMVGVTAYVTLRSAADDAHKLATRLHEEISDNINLQLDEYLSEKPNASDESEISALLKSLPIAKHGVALIIGRAGHIVASSAKEDDPVAAEAVVQLRESSASSAQLKEGIEFRFDYVAEKPLSREVWLAHATAYEDRRGGHTEWTVLTLMPQSFYLAGVQAGNSRSAMVFAVALLLALTVAAILAAMVANPLRRISLATQALAQGDLNQHAPGSRMEELNVLARSFNDMADRLKQSFDHLNNEIELRNQADEGLRASDQLLRHFIKHTPAAVAMFDKEMRYVQASDRWITDYHLEGKNIIGRSHYDVFPDVPEHWKEVHSRALRGHSERCDEDMFPRADGRIEWLQWEVRPWYASENAIGGVIFFTQVITERKRIELKLRESEELFRTSFESATVGVCMVGTDGRFLNVNRTWCDMLGYSRDELLQLTFNDVTYEEDREVGRTFLGNALAGGPQIMQTEKRYLHKNGRVVWAFLSTAFIEQWREQGGYMISHIQDITERKQAEEALRDSERRFRTLIEEAPVAINIARGLTNLYTNRKCREMFGFNTLDELKSHPLMERFAPEHRAMLAERARQRALGLPVPNQYECTGQRKDGSQFHIELNVGKAELPDGPASVASFTDITERKQAEEKLRETESSLRALINAVQDGLFLMTPDGRLTIVNEAIARRFGKTVEELIGTDVYDQIPEPLATRRRGYAQTVMQSGQPLTVEDQRGSLELETRFYPAKDTAGKITHIALFSQDITERKKADVRLLEQAALLDQASDAILVTDLSNRITYWNRSAERLFGWKEEEAIGLRPEELFTDFPIEQVEAYRKSLAEHGRWSGELALRPRTGEPLNLDFRVTRAFDAAGRPRGRMLVGTDVTEKKKIHEQFLRAQRLESIGMLAAGISHDLNNVLAPIGIISDELRPKLAGDKNAELLDVLDNCARRGADLIDQILGFARGVGGEAALVHAGLLLHDIEMLIRKTFPKSISIASEIPNNLWPITCNPTQIHQILLNLCVNARDAMPDGGTLTLRAENRELDADAANAIAGATTGKWLVLHVADTGIGMTAETLAHIWEPFFTTKSRDHGTGLGLPTVRGIVETHKGFISVDTAPGRGTTFQVCLPAS